MPRINRYEQRNRTRDEPDPNANPTTHLLLCNTTTGSLLTYRAIRGSLREMGTGNRDIRETVTTCRFTEQLLINISIQGVSWCSTFSQSWHCQATF
jgi:hypothetical protein